MKYKFIPRSLQNWSVQESAMLDEALELIMHYDRDAPFMDLSFYLANVSKADYVAISRVVPANKDIFRTLAYVKGNTVLDNLEYNKKGTPCENVIGHNICYFPSGVQQQFPEDDYLRYLNIESYLGYPLNDKYDNTIGLIALLSCQTIKNPEFLEYLLTTIAPFLEEKLVQNQIKELS